MSDPTIPQPPEQQLTPERVRELIAREYNRLDDVVAYVRSGIMAARLKPDHGEMLIESAMRYRDASVRLLRELIGAEER